MIVTMLKTSFCSKLCIYLETIKRPTDLSKSLKMRPPTGSMMMMNLSQKRMTKVSSNITKRIKRHLLQNMTELLWATHRPASETRKIRSSESSSIKWRQLTNKVTKTELELTRQETICSHGAIKISAPPCKTLNM